MSSTLREELAGVRWIGGGPGAGKTTVARRLAKRYGFHLYVADDALQGRGEWLNRPEYPLTQAFMAMDMDQRWVRRSPKEMFRTFHRFQGEGFDVIVDDLRALAGGGTGVIAEGLSLIPRLVAPLLTTKRQAVWLIPTSEFSRDAIEARGGKWSIAGRTSDPERALANLRERDELFGRDLRRQVAELGLRALVIDGTDAADAVVRRVADVFDLCHSSGLSDDGGGR